MGTDKNLTRLLTKLCSDGPVTYHDYIDCVLYAPSIGYYTRQNHRVGRDSKRDFYTAESLGTVFSRLITTAVQDILGDERTRKSTFVEIAAEPEGSLLGSLPTHPFAAQRTIRHGDALQVAGPCVIFANEWLDALPFHRIRFVDGEWRERGVNFDTETNSLTEVLLDQLSESVFGMRERLPRIAPDGYEIDLPLSAPSMLGNLLQQDWEGLLLLFDYGKTWKALTKDRPNGTARTFQKHVTGNDLLDQPGQKDITCDVCWDFLMEQLQGHNLESLTLESQESFLAKRAGRAAASIIEETAGQFSEAKQTLMELMHPSHMGQRFQVLWGLRRT